MTPHRHDGGMPEQLQHRDVVAPPAATTVQFAAAARALAAAARRFGLAAPTFRTPPRLVGLDRTVRRHPQGGVVSVRLRGRPWVAVLADMIDGVVAVNRLDTRRANRARGRPVGRRCGPRRGRSGRAPGAVARRRLASTYPAGGVTTTRRGRRRPQSPGQEWRARPPPRGPGWTSRLGGDDQDHHLGTIRGERRPGGRALEQVRCFRYLESEIREPAPVGVSDGGGVSREVPHVGVELGRRQPEGEVDRRVVDERPDAVGHRNVVPERRPGDWGIGFAHRVRSSGSAGRGSPTPRRRSRTSTTGSDRAPHR